MSRPNRLRIADIGAVCATALLLPLTPWGHPGFFGLALLTIVVGVSNTALIHVTIARQRVSFTLTEGFVAGAYLMAPGAWIIVATVVGLIPMLVINKSSLLKIQHNVAQYIVATTLATFVVVHLHGSIPACVVGMAMWWIANQVMSAVPLSIMGGESFRKMLYEDASLQIVHAAGTTSMGLLASWLLIHAPFGLLGLLVPVMLLWISFDEQTSRSGEARLFAELARGQERAITHSIDVSARIVLTAAARVLGGADVELVVVEHEGLVVYTGDESGQTKRRNDAHAFDLPWVLNALGAGGVLTGSEDGRPFCSAVVGEADQPMAVLIARRAHGSASFGRREAALAGVLVSQAKSWLSMAELAASRDEALARADAADNAARSLGGIGADTAPALGMLRDSATRLARLASVPSGEDGVTDIVDELHSVERAVASLLGAIALAADPSLRDLDSEMDALGLVPARREEDWTTTGLVTKSELVR
ncbi:MAG: hypothetical protein QOJ62_1454 [Actinomycetota bacterium]|nr:hypothetical protein [Actinomycetota bacterium]